MQQAATFAGFRRILQDFAGRVLQNANPFGRNDLRRRFGILQETGRLLSTTTSGFLPNLRDVKQFSAVWQRDLPIWQHRRFSDVR
jgi:hypothetical protein